MGIMCKKYLIINISVQDGYKIVDDVPKELPRFWKKSNKKDEWFDKFQKDFVNRIETPKERK